MVSGLPIMIGLLGIRVTLPVEEDFTADTGTEHVPIQNHRMVD